MAEAFRRYVHAPWQREPLPSLSVMTREESTRVSNAKTRNGTKTAESIRTAAVNLFFEHGYEATTLREIAAGVNIQVGSLYNHIPSKEDLLFSIMSGVIEDLILELDERLKPLKDPIERLRTAVRVHVEFHTHRAREVFIGNSELRSLTQEHRSEVIALRDQYEDHIVGILKAGTKAGVFQVDDPKLSAYAIVTIGTQVAGWYHEGGRYRLPQIAEHYISFILRGLGVDVAPTRNGATTGVQRRRTKPNSLKLASRPVPLR